MAGHDRDKCAGSDVVVGDAVGKPGDTEAGSGGAGQRDGVVGQHQRRVRDAPLDGVIEEARLVPERVVDRLAGTRGEVAVAVRIGVAAEGLAEERHPAEAREVERV